MQLITRDTDYAVRALRYLAQHGDTVIPVSQLCTKLDVPKAYLRRILQTLAKERVLFSYRGKGGGFRLRRRPNEIRLTDLMSIFQGDPDFTRCVVRGEACSHQGACSLRKRIKQIEESAVAELQATTLASLI